MTIILFCSENIVAMSCQMTSWRLLLWSASTVVTIKMILSASNSSPCASLRQEDILDTRENYSEYSGTNRTCEPFLEDVYNDPTVVTVFKTLAFLLIISVSLLCNSLVIIVARISQRMQNSTNHFIINMAFSDLLMTMVCMPPAVHSVIVGPARMDFHGALGIVVCKLITFLQGVSVAVSVLTLLAISLDRFLAIVFPFAHFVNLKVSHIIIGVIWFVSMAITSPLLYSVTLYDSDGETECTEEWGPLFSDHAYNDYSLVVFFCLYVFPLTGIAVLYAMIAWQLWRRKPQHIYEQSTRKENKAVISMLVAVVVGFCLCWLPFQIRFVFPWIYQRDYSGSLRFAGLFLGYSNSAVNPVILIIFSKNYRQGIKNIFLCCPSPTMRVTPTVMLS